MKKWFLLIAGDQYYPSFGVDDWIACFPDKESAMNTVTEVVHISQVIAGRGANKRVEEVKRSTWKIGSREYDWYEIVDLRDWVSK